MSDGVHYQIHPNTHKTRERIGHLTMTALDRLCDTLRFQDDWTIHLQLHNGISVTASPVDSEDTAA